LKVAITADLHLTKRQDHPERFHALESILRQMIEEQIDTLIIAGDLFHETSRNYAEFDKVCRSSKYSQIQFHVIPGNHDARIDSSMFGVENVIVYSEPGIQRFDLMSLPFLFLPYRKEKTMGEWIAAFAAELEGGGWILIGHGDWIEGMGIANPVEPGVYMPLTRTDLEVFKPTNVVLGHIHKPTDGRSIHYAGSPCPVDINETGRRRFLVIDVENGTVSSRSVSSDRIFFDESFLILPVEDESAYLGAMIESRVQEWGLTDEEKSRTRIRIKVRGYSSNKRRLKEILKTSFRDFSYYNDEEPNVDGVFIADDVERADIASRVVKIIEGMGWPGDDDEPTKDQVLLEALHVIYGD
jgi:DNA repair exonuclease SbcCD nuclease subunit